MLNPVKGAVNGALGLAGLVKISDLLIIDESFLSLVNQAQREADREVQAAETLRAEAETKLKNANARAADAKRITDAVARIRQAVGETKVA